MKNELIKGTYNTYYAMYSKHTCDPVLADILARHMGEPNYLHVLRVTYDLYKKYRSLDPHGDLFWDGFLRESNALAADCNCQMCVDVLVYFAEYFEGMAKE